MIKKITEYILSGALWLYKITHLKYEKDKDIKGYCIKPIYKKTKKKNKKIVKEKQLLLG